MSDAKKVHVVKQGDSLWGISRHYDVDINRLARLNHLEGRQRHMLRIGQVVEIPDDSEGPDTELTLRILDLAFRPIKRAKLKLEFDGGSKEIVANDEGETDVILIDDHAKGLKVHFKSLDGQYQLIADHKALPTGRKRLTLTSRKMVVHGNYLPQQGAQRRTSTDVARDVKGANSDPHITPGEGQRSAGVGAAGGEPRAAGSTGKPSTSGVSTKPVPKPDPKNSGPETNAWDDFMESASNAWDDLVSWGSAYASPSPQPPLKKPPEPVVLQTRIEEGRPLQAIGAVFAEDNLHLAPANEVYRKILIATAKKYDFTSQVVAAVINAEAAKRRKDGYWLPDSYNSNSGAGGLTQFLMSTWLQCCADKRSLMHPVLKETYDPEGKYSRFSFSGSTLYGTRVVKVKGKYRKVKDALPKPYTKLVQLRFNAEYAIDTSVLYAKDNLTAIENAGLSVSTLPPEDLAKLIYLAHHDGSAGAVKIMKGARDEKWVARLENEVFWRQVGKDKADALTKRQGGDVVMAYRIWVYGYVDSMINVTQFMVKPGALKPRPLSEIAASVVRGVSTPPPTTKPVPAAVVQQVSPPPATQRPQKSAAIAPTAAKAPGVSAADTGLAATGWHNPLDYCVIRSKGLVSWRSATFGKVRNNGTKNHQGVDLAAEPGTAIKAVAHGKVIAVANNEADFATRKNFGASILLEVAIEDLMPAQRQHYTKSYPGITSVWFFYAHLSRIDVDTGKRAWVEPGQTIGATGCSGNAYEMKTIDAGAHLHFEARFRTENIGLGLSGRLDPMPFIQNCVVPK